MPLGQSLAERALAQIPDLSAAIDELAAPARALARVAAARAPVGPVLESLGGLEAPSSPIEQALVEGRRAAVKVRDRGPEAADLTPGEQVGLEAVILLFGRPALLVQNGTFAAPPPGWESLEAERPRVEASLRSVGRIELANGPMLGTGFLVAPDVVMTNRHVAEIFSVPSDGGGWMFKLGRSPAIDYVDETDAIASASCKVTEVIGIHPDVRIDLALLRVHATPTGPTPPGWTPPPPLPVAGTSPDFSGAERRVYLVGYPATDNQGITPPEVMTRIFGGIFEVKRLQPGTVTSVSATLPRFSHDCSTLGGNSGSCVIDLETHQVIGLHFSGSYRETNYAVALWKLAGDPLLGGAGVQFA